MENIPVLLVNQRSIKAQKDVDSKLHNVFVFNRKALYVFIGLI